MAMAMETVVVNVEVEVNCILECVFEHLLPDFAGEGEVGCWWWWRHCVW